VFRIPRRSDPLSWIKRLRLRVLALVGGLVLAVCAIASVTTLPVWGLIGVAFAAAAFTVNTMTSRLSQPTCWGCGETLDGVPAGEHGLACPHCGSLTPKL